MIRLETVKRARVEIGLAEKDWDEWKAMRPVLDAIEGIEPEVNRRCAEWPPGADGQPWLPTDELFADRHGNVYSLFAISYGTRTGEWWLEGEVDDQVFPAKECHHVARTVEDVLKELVFNARQGGLTSLQVDDAIAKYAAELRMKGGDE